MARLVISAESLSSGHHASLVGQCCTRLANGQTFSIRRAASNTVGMRLCVPVKTLIAIRLFCRAAIIVQTRLDDSEMRFDDSPDH